MLFRAVCEISDAPESTCITCSCEHGVNLICNKLSKKQEMGWKQSFTKSRFSVNYQHNFIFRNEVEDFNSFPT